MYDILKIVRKAVGEGGCVRNKEDVRRLNPLVLAYIGDTVYDLFIRTYLIHTFDCSVHQLHVKATGFVKAKAQSDTIQKVYGQLTEEEQAVFRRGRNAKSGTVPKNADVTEYRHATGFESLLGYLYLREEEERLAAILTLSLNLAGADEEAESMKLIE